MYFLFITFCMATPQGDVCEELKDRNTYQTMDQCVEAGRQKINTAPVDLMAQNGVKIDSAICRAELHNDQA